MDTNEICRFEEMVLFDVIEQNPKHILQKKKIFTLQDYIFQVMLHVKQLSEIFFPVSAYNQVSIFIEAYMTWATLV